MNWTWSVTIAVTANTDPAISTMDSARWSSLANTLVVPSPRPVKADPLIGCSERDPTQPVDGSAARTQDGANRHAPHLTVVDVDASPPAHASAIAVPAPADGGAVTGTLP
jgi:hypothetical protein